jgi:hypothetical protein
MLGMKMQGANQIGPLMQFARRERRELTQPFTLT